MARTTPYIGPYYQVDTTMYRQLVEGRPAAVPALTWKGVPIVASAAVRPGEVWMVGPDFIKMLGQVYVGQSLRRELPAILARGLPRADGPIEMITESF